MHNKIKFIKTHGIGNDFVMINADDLPKSEITKPLIMQISNRKLGIGCDQLILYQHIEENKYEMIIYNSDGSKADACGNATRALTMLLYEHYHIKSVEIIVSNRSLKCQYKDQNNISVNMGIAMFEKEWIPRKSALIKLAQIYQISMKEIMCVDVGNPHLIIFHSFDIAQEYKQIAQNIQNSNIFKDGININFVTIDKENNLYIKSWERGLNDFSLACGSGACASFAAAAKLGFVKEYANIHFAIGSLKLSYDINNNIIMEGAAKKVFVGEYILEKFQ